MDYHAIVFDVSQKRRAIFRKLDIIGRKRFWGGHVVACKLAIAPQRLEATIDELQANMRRRSFLFPHGFYFHVYRGDELIVVFKDRRFCTSTDPATWRRTVAYGRSVGIPLKQLDFAPCRIEDETY